MNDKRQEQAAWRGLHAKLTAIIEAELENLPALLAEMDTRDRVRAIIQMLPYISPKVNAVTTYTIEHPDERQGSVWDLDI